jgi:DNA adenine methylase
MGSKARIAKEISPIIQRYIDENDKKIYIEPFVGGANMMEKIRCNKKIGADNNEYLIDMWKSLQQGWKPPETMTREMYNSIKDHKEDYGKALVAIAGFCATYNAKWFGGYAGIVHTKIDTDRNYYDEAVRNIINQAFKLDDVEFVAEDYTYFTGFKNAIIYCDPPYQGTTLYGTSKNFDYDIFWQWIRDISKENKVFISEYNAPKDFKCIWSKELTTTLDKASRSQSIEKLFVYNN